MLEWVFKSLDGAPEVIEHVRELHYGCHRPAALWIGLALAIPLGYLIYRRQRNLVAVRRPVSLALTATRIILFLFLDLVLAEPYLRLDHETYQKPILAFLLDESQSMQLPVGEMATDGELKRHAVAGGYARGSGPINAADGKRVTQSTRLQHAQAVIEQSKRTVLEPLARKYDLRFYSLSTGLAPLQVEAVDPHFAGAPTVGGKATHLGQALQECLDQAGSEPMAAMVLFSDGQNTGGPSPMDVAGRAAAAGAPVFTVPVGSSVPLRDIAIVDTFTAGQVAVGDMIRVAVTVESHSFDRRQVQVELREEQKLLDSKPLVLSGTEPQSVELTFEASEPGVHYLTASIAPPADEAPALHANNADTAVVRVTDNPIRVVYVEGMPRWDFRFLKNSMRRDHGLGGRNGREPDILLEAELRRTPAAQQAHPLPKDINELAQYHTIILGDVSANFLGGDFLQALDQAVRERGVGLVIEAGPRAMPHAFPSTFQQLLPLYIAPGASGLEAGLKQPFQLELTPEGTLMDALRFLEEPEQNRQAWSHLPPYYWALAAERPAAGATVLATNPVVGSQRAKQPIIAWHYAGRGKVLLIGTDSTWLWRQNVGERYFSKFWGQSIRFVARQDPLEARRNAIEVNPLRLHPGQPAEVELSAYDKDGNPRQESVQRLRLTGPTGPATTLEVSAVPERKGHYRGTLDIVQAGDYRLTFEPGGHAVLVETQVRVLPSNEEYRHTQVNRSMLEQLARTSGGRMLELPELSTLPSQIKAESHRVSIHREMTLWDNWLFLAIVLCIYTLDIGIRRLAGLS